MKRQILIGVTVLLALTLTTAVQARPNPVGDREAAVTVTLDKVGGYQATEQLTVTMFEDSAYDFGGRVAAGFLRPGDGVSPLPPILLVDVTQVQFSVDGMGQEAQLAVDGRAYFLDLVPPLRKGNHRAQVSYQRGGATVIDGQLAYTYIGVFGARKHMPGQVAIADPADAITQVRCVTVPPDSKPCGSRQGSSWVVPNKENPTNTIIAVRPAHAVTVGAPKLETK